MANPMVADAAKTAVSVHKSRRSCFTPARLLPNFPPVPLPIPDSVRGKDGDEEKERSVEGGRDREGEKYLDDDKDEA